MRYSPSLQLALASLIFGVGSLFVVFIDFDAVIIAFYRLFFGACLFAGVLIYRRESMYIPLKALWYAILSGVMLGIDLALWNVSILAVGPGVATILNSLQIFFMAAFGVVVLGNSMNVRLLLSLVVSFIGVVLLCAHEVQNVSGGKLGVIAGVASAVAFAASMLAMRAVASHQSGSLMNTMLYASLGGAIALGIFGLLTGRDFGSSEPLSWCLMLLYGSVVHVCAWSLMARAIPLLPVAIVGLLFCLEPVVVIAVDVGVLDKLFTGWQMLGALLTIVAVYCGSLRKS